MEKEEQNELTIDEIFEQEDCYDAIGGDWEG